MRHRARHGAPAVRPVPGNHAACAFVTPLTLQALTLAYCALPCLLKDFLAAFRSFFARPGIGIILAAGTLSGFAGQFFNPFGPSANQGLVNNLFVTSNASSKATCSAARATGASCARASAP